MPVSNCTAETDTNRVLGVIWAMMSCSGWVFDNVTAFTTTPWASSAAHGSRLEGNSLAGKMTSSPGDQLRPVAMMFKASEVFLSSEISSALSASKNCANWPRNASSLAIQSS